MDDIVAFLKPYQALIGNAAVYLAIAVHLSEINTCRKIFKNGNTDNISSIVLATNVMMGLIRYKTGILLNDNVILGINTAAILLNSLWSGFYYIYAKDKWNEIIKQFSICIVLAAIMWRYTEWEDPDLIGFRYGLIGTVLTFALMFTPAVATKNIIMNKDASQVSLLWTCLSAAFAFSTILYSSLMDLPFMLVQGVASFFLSSLRILLVFVYQERSVKSDEKKKN